MDTKNEEIFKDREPGFTLLEVYITTNERGGQKLPIVERNLYDEMHPDDQKYFDDLPDKLEVHRGTRRAEYESGNYGQSWSLSEDIALNFSGMHDSNKKGKPELLKECITLKAQILKSDVYAFVNKHPTADHKNELECIVNPSSLRDVKIYFEVDSEPIEESDE